LTIRPRRPRGASYAHCVAMVEPREGLGEKGKGGGGGGGEGGGGGLVWSMLMTRHEKKQVKIYECWVRQNFLQKLYDKK